MGCSVSKKQIDFEAKHETDHKQHVGLPLGSSDACVGKADSESTTSPGETDGRVFLVKREVHGSLLATATEHLEIMACAKESDAKKGSCFFSEPSGVEAPADTDAEVVDAAGSVPSAAEDTMKSDMQVPFLQVSEQDEEMHSIESDHAETSKTIFETDMEGQNQSLSSPKQPEGEPSPLAGGGAVAMDFKTPEAFFTDDEGTDHEALDGAWNTRRRTSNSVVSEDSVMNIPASPFGPLLTNIYGSDSDESIFNIPISPVERSLASMKTMQDMDGFPISHIVTNTDKKNKAMDALPAGRFFESSSDEDHMPKNGGGLTFLPADRVPRRRKKVPKPADALPPRKAGVPKSPRKSVLTEEEQAEKKVEVAKSRPLAVERPAAAKSRISRAPVKEATPPPAPVRPPRPSTPSGEGEGEVKRRSVWERLAETSTASVMAGKNTVSPSPVKIKLPVKDSLAPSTPRRPEVPPECQVAKDSGVPSTPRQPEARATVEVTEEEGQEAEEEVEEEELQESEAEEEEGAGEEQESNGEDAE